MFRDVLDDDLIAEAKPRRLADRRNRCRPEHSAASCRRRSVLAAAGRRSATTSPSSYRSRSRLVPSITSKPAGDDNCIWHQDGSYWPLERWVVSLWLAMGIRRPKTAACASFPLPRIRLGASTPRRRRQRANLGMAEAAVDEAAAVGVCFARRRLDLPSSIIHGSNANLCRTAAAPHPSDTSDHHPHRQREQLAVALLLGAGPFPA